ncbi:hypothetical protein [Tolypothrix sp. VBCCA 56010]|uniref:hypothetical protein n=1 Tax=Tolypothrix sp. VBCCA 56010 TaxID=3137731 RepID=UPI003D7DE04F
MISPWQSPLPLEEHKTRRVVVYFYSDRLSLWIPIVFFQLIEALELHRKGLFKGVEFFIFPPDLDPCNWGEGERGEHRGRWGEFLRGGDGELHLPYYSLPITHSQLPITHDARCFKSAEPTADAPLGETPRPHCLPNALAPPCPMPNAQ